MLPKSYVNGINNSYMLLHKLHVFNCIYMIYLFANKIKFLYKQAIPIDIVVLYVVCLTHDT